MSPASVFRRIPSRARTFAIVAAALLAWSAVGAPLQADSFKPYSLDGVPAALNVGLNASLSTITISVPSTASQQLGSLEIGISPLSPGYAFQSVGGSYGSATSASGGLLAVQALSSTLLLIQNLNIQPGQSGSVTIAGIEAPCSGTLTWTFQAQQANQWNSGNKANYLTLTSVDGSTTLPFTSTLTGACHLAFIAPSSGGPAVSDAEVLGGPDGSAVQTLSAGVPGGGAGVEVGVYDPGNALVTTGSYPISLGLQGGNAAAVLGGTKTVSSSGGVAVFSDLTVSAAGLGYQLPATSPGLTQATSNLFNVVPTLMPCNPNKSSCTVTFSSTTSSQLTAQSPQVGNYFAGGTNLAGLTISCAFSPFNYLDTYDPVTTWVYYAGPTGSTKTVVLTIPKSVVQITANNGVSFYEVCYASPVEFNTGIVTGYDATTGAAAAGGTGAVPIPMSGGPAGNNATSYFSAIDGGATWYVGTLPDCSSVGSAPPCLQSKGSQGGGRVLTFITPATDPGYR